MYNAYEFDYLQLVYLELTAEFKETYIIFSLFDTPTLIIVPPTFSHLNIHFLRNLNVSI